MNHNDSLHRVLAFYGFEFGDTVWKQFFEWSMSLFQRYSCSIWKIAPRGKMLTVKGALRMIREQGHSGFDSLTISSIPDDVKNHWEGCWLSACISGRMGFCYVELNPENMVHPPDSPPQR